MPMCVNCHGLTEVTKYEELVQKNPHNNHFVEYDNRF